MEVACGYTIPITLYGLPPSPEDHLKGMQIVGKAGFKAIELEFTDHLVPAHRRDLPKMKSILKEYGMRCASIMAVEEHMFSVDPGIKRQAISDFDAITDLIAELSCPMVAICGYMPPEIRPKGTELYVGGPPTAVTVGDDFSWPKFWSNAVDLVRRLAETANSKGLTLTVETRANDVFSSTDAVMNLLRESGAKNAGVILDVAHVHAGKEYLALVIPKLDGLIKLVHLSDNDGTNAYHYSPGQGNIDFPAVISSLKRAGFDGFLVVDTAGVPNIVEEAVRARDYYQGLIAAVPA
ncbi:MAG: sugar phosphate isomerase/epimerase [Acidobacteria bacterium]|nr:MAG: sugar phosphate isomerase/epimerase [Acidobacteriota bacterium]